MASGPSAASYPASGRSSTVETRALAAPPAARVWQHRAVLAGVTLLALVPFLGKPLHVDDPLFVWTARHIQSHPLDFYGFQVNWFGFDAPMSDMMKNPPLASYYLAAAALLLGFSEVSLHLAQLVPAVAATLGMYEVARQFCGRPLLAALLALTTPVFVLCGTTVMCDMPLLALWCWSIAFWHRGLVENRPGLLLSGAVLVALASLTKYFGMSLIPLLLLDAIEVRRRPTLAMLWLILPIAVMVAYQYATKSLYGYGLVSDAGAYATKANEVQGSPRDLDGVFRTLVFLGGCVIGTVLFAPRFWSWPSLAGGAGVVLSFGVLAVIRGWAHVLQEVTTLDGPEGWALLAHVVVFLGAGATAVALVASDLWSQRAGGTFFLAAWFVGTLVFAGFVNWMINGRSLLPLVPALGILAARRLDGVEGSPSSRWVLGELAHRDWILVGVGLGTALVVAAGDYAHAASARTAADIIGRKYVVPEKRFVYVGHWGFQYYLEPYGAVALDSSKMDFELNDQIAVPRFNTNNLMMPEKIAASIDLVEVPMTLPIATMRKSENAGFYGSNSHGRLPWCVGELPPDQYVIQAVRQPFRLRIKPPEIR